MKAKVDITYDIDKLPADMSMKKADKLIVSNIKPLIDGQFYSVGLNTDNIRNISFNLEISENKIINYKNSNESKNRNNL